ncbi:MAG TPA: aldolase/citrate lyase family protein [Bryobacterales bacterium]|nr:aldolase/citrate lyase family protein [Bryobacterales bacterium]
MKPNLLRERIAAGRVAVGHMVMEFATRGIAKIVEAAGLDFVLLDMEHSGISLDRMADLIAWFKATPVAPIVRVPAPHYHFIARVLDAGALGVMIPNVETVEQARTIVNAVKYAPEGRRGLGLGSAHNDYVPPKPVEYLREANANTTVICQIESRRGLENLEAITAVPGVDILWVGHFDLTQSLGIVAQFQNPQFLEALARVADAAHRHGKAAGIQPASREQAADWVKLGYNVVSFSSDISVYRSALAGAVEAVRQMGNGK